MTCRAPVTGSNVKVCSAPIGLWAKLDYTALGLTAVCSGKHQMHRVGGQPGCGP